MSKRRKGIILLACVILAPAVLWQLLRDREPSYQGRTLSDWLKRYEETGTDSAEEAEAAAAVLAIGTNALPHLLDWIQHEPGWRDWLYDHLPSEIADTHFVESWLTGPENYADYASYGFWILGTNAACAIPELEPMMRDPTRHETANCAIDALGSIGEPAVPLLKAALADTNQVYRSRIIWEFSHMIQAGGHTNTYLPLLIEALNQGDAEVRATARNALREIAPEVATNAPPQ